jgi:signal transduction histidine kinase
LTIYFAITGTYAGFAPDSVLVYAPKAISIAEKLNEKEKAVRNYHHLGIAYCLLNNHDTAVMLLNKSYEISAGMQDSDAQISALWLTAFVYATNGKYVTAIDMYMKLLPIFENEGEKYLTTHVAALANIAELNRKLGNMGITLKYLDMAVELCAKVSDKEFYIWRITQIYNEYSIVYFSKNNIAQALDYALKSDSVNHGGYVINKCSTKVLLAKIYSRLNDYERALRYAGEAMKLADIIKSNSMYIDVRKVLSDIYLAQKRYPEAEAEALKAWRADSTNINESRSVAANIVLANICMRNMEKAAYYSKRYSELNRQYSEKSFHTAVSDLSIKYESEKKEMQLSSIKWQKFFHLLISIAGVLLAAGVWIVFRLKVRREQTKKQVVASRAILEGENNERKRIARDLHDDLGGMISSVKMELNAMEHTQNIRDRLDVCIDEIHRVVTGMMPSSLTHFGMKAAIEDYCRQFANVHFDFFGEGKRIDEKIEIAVYYCAYELVNNAVRHSGASAINVQLIQERNRVSLTVQDNGCGFDSQAVVSNGLGLKKIKYRTAAFNGITDIMSSPNNGAEITVEFKI